MLVLMMVFNVRDGDEGTIKTHQKKHDKSMSTNNALHQDSASTSNLRLPVQFKAHPLWSDLMSTRRTLFGDAELFCFRVFLHLASLQLHLGEEPTDDVSVVCYDDYSNDSVITTIPSMTSE